MLQKEGNEQRLIFYLKHTLHTHTLSRLIFYLKHTLHTHTHSLSLSLSLNFQWHSLFPFPVWKVTLKPKIQDAQKVKSEVKAWESRFSRKAIHGRLHFQGTKWKVRTPFHFPVCSSSHKANQNKRKPKHLIFSHCMTN